MAHTKRRSKMQIEQDNIKYVLHKNREVIKEALDKYDSLTDSGFTTSFAYQKVNLEGGRFDFENKNYGEVLTELTRLFEFNSDPSSVVANARREGNKYLTLFGKGQWTRTNIYEMTTESRDPEVARFLLNEEIAKKAFTAYRNIERMRAAEIVGVGGFGSDTFVGYLYSMELQGKDSYIMGNALLDSLEESRYGIHKEFDAKEFIPSSYSAATRGSLRQKKKGDIYDNEW